MMRYCFRFPWFVVTDGYCFQETYVGTKSQFRRHQQKGRGKINKIGVCALFYSLLLLSKVMTKVHLTLKIYNPTNNSGKLV